MPSGSGVRRQHAGNNKTSGNKQQKKKKVYFFEGFEQFWPLILYALSGLLLQLPQQCCD